MTIQRVIVLGSTGSIGRASLEVLAALGDRFTVCGLAAGSNWQLLARQAAKFRPQVVALAEERHADRLREAIPAGCEVIAGPESATGLIERSEAEIVIAAIVGVAGLRATFKAVNRCRRLALANKESLVVAGSLLTAAARKNGTEIIPIDSEHSAVFQAMRAGRREEVARVYLTASGGPFRDWSVEQMNRATVDQALAHPTWKMGRKITIDSATMMNKALEIIEARWLFDLRPEQISVLVHPESLVHALVEFCDGSLVAQIATPDMRLPIRYALTYPERTAGPGRKLRFDEITTLHFEPPDVERFPAIRLGYEVARQGGTAGAVLNAANEVAVEAFLKGRITFRQIVSVTEQVLKKHRTDEADSLETVLEADRWARKETESLLQKAGG